MDGRGKLASALWLSLAGTASLWGAVDGAGARRSQFEDRIPGAVRAPELVDRSSEIEKPAVGRPRSVVLIHGVVVAVHDGDTLTLQCADGRRLKLRLYGIDAPELKQPYGPESRDALQRLVGGREVTAEVRGHDRYRRTLAVIRCGPTCVNEAQVASGLSWWYARYAMKDLRLKILEAEARQARVGLWSEYSPVAPWGFRSAARQRSGLVLTGGN